jgi:hypothetical protein
MKQVLVMMYEDILDFHKQALRFFSERGENRCQPLFQALNH